MLASGAHIKIGDVECLLDESVLDHYQHTTTDPQTFFSTQEAGPHITHATLYHQIRYWFQSDWQQGEGFQFWGNDPDNDGYDQGYLNPRIPGVLATRPNRYETTKSGRDGEPDGNPKLIGFAEASGYSWLASNQNLWFSTEGSNWHEFIGISNTDKEQFTAITGDGPYCYLMQAKSPDTDGSTPILVYRLDKNSPGNNVQSTVIDTTTNPSRVCRAMVHNQGLLYLWSGNAMRGYDITAPGNFPYTSISSATVDEVFTDENAGQPDYADAVVGDRFIYAMSAWQGTTRVYGFGLWDGTIWSGREIWQLPRGFTGRSVAFTSGLLFIVGEYNGRAAAFMLSVQTLQSAFVGYVRPWAEGTLVEAVAGPGAQVLMMHSTEGVFIYDYLTDAISALDTLGSTSNVDVGNKTPPSLGCFQGWRLACYTTGNHNYHIIRWDHDYSVRSESTGVYHYLPTWHYGFTTLDKLLLGFEIHTQPLRAGDKITVEYKLEEDGIYQDFPSTPADGGWESMGHVSYEDDGAATSKYFDVSAQGTSFNRIRFRLRVKGRPKILGTSVPIWMGDHQETWVLQILLNDESPSAGPAQNRPRSQQRRGEEIRKALWGHIRSKSAVTFLDGYAYKGATGLYDTYTVVIEGPTDTIQEDAQGNMKVTLRRVDKTGLE